MEQYDIDIPDEMNIEKYMNPGMWREGGPFYLTLDFSSITAVRGAARAIMRDAHGDFHDILIPDFAEIVPHMVNGKISGKFKIQKRGQKYGLKLWGVR